MDEPEKFAKVCGAKNCEFVLLADPLRHPSMLTEATASICLSIRIIGWTSSALIWKLGTEPYPFLNAGFDYLPNEPFRWLGVQVGLTWYRLTES